MRKLRKGRDADGLKGDKEKLKGVIVIKNKQLFFETVVCFIAVCYLYLYLGQFTRNYTQTTKRGLLTTNKG
mgnify:FL=1